MLPSGDWRSIIKIRLRKSIYNCAKNTKNRLQAKNILTDHLFSKFYFVFTVQFLIAVGYAESFLFKPAKRSAGFLGLVLSFFRPASPSRRFPFFRPHPLSREHFSLKIDGRDQTIWICILEL